ncbi:hypothetical protein QPK87_05910 [Kamptonema cortianum]|nr:hypothetical protein [Kamptonema cortianum]
MPSIVIPDDHDVYHGNYWGAGGKLAVAKDGMTAQDSGGYRHGGAFVNAVHRTQTSHLPDPFDATLVGELKIEPYTTQLDWAGVSYGVISDRMFKDSPSVMVPEGEFVNGWPRKDGFDGREADVPGAQLLGEMQHRFLNSWAADWGEGIEAKALVSQTIFANVTTIPESANNGGVFPSLNPTKREGDWLPGDKLAMDADTNGWPQSARNDALRLIRKCFAVHFAGDQHLPTLTQYGVDSFRDAGFAFCVPAGANTWPRRWHPPTVGMNMPEGADRKTGDFFDGFGNRVTVWAVANPFEITEEPVNLHQRVPGYGIVRFRKPMQQITFECWPRRVDPLRRGAQQYLGWPKTVLVGDNYAFEPVGFLPALDTGVIRPVVQVWDEATGELVFARRFSDRVVNLPVPKNGVFTVKYGASSAALFVKRGVVSIPRL